MLYQKPSLNKPPQNFFTMILFFLCLLPMHALHAQQIDILLKGGHVIDPKNKIDTQMDIGIAGSKIYEVSPNIPANDAKRIIDVTGLYVNPRTY